jgi:hypothetical protein
VLATTAAHDGVHADLTLLLRDGTPAVQPPCRADGLSRRNTPGRKRFTGMWRVTSGHADSQGYGAAAERVKPGP